jgi:DNA replication protein DnaC
LDKSKEICPLCNSRGIVFIDNDRAAPCRCMQNKKLETKFRNAKMSSEMLKYGFNQFASRYYSKNCRDDFNGNTYYDNAAAAYTAVQQFVRDIQEKRFTDGLVFTGPVGSGKTFLACAVANTLLEGGQEVLFVIVPDLLDQIRASYDSSNEDTEQDLIETARRVEVLILDDLGAHNYTDWARNKLYTIINYRLNNELPTVITTNLNLAELEEYIGERSTSRIIQMCKTYRLVVETDIRIVKRHEKDSSGLSVKK